jgi:hypothetical protein
MLLLDADADPAITECVAPGAGFQAIDIQPQAEVVQVADRTLSNTWLLDPDRGPGRRRDILTLIRREVECCNNRGVLVVSTKVVLAALHRDAGNEIAANDDAGLRTPLFGAQPRWFGPRMQGVNDFEDFGTVIVIGRLQPPHGDIEDATRCLFGDDQDPIIAADPGSLPKQPSWWQLADSGLAEATIRSHPDQRAAVVLSQMRECQSLQAIARLRLVAPSLPKRVVLLSSLPLPSFPVTKLIPFDVVARGLEDEPDPHGFIRLEKALRATMGRSVRGTRLSAAGLASDLPLDFPSIDAAKHFRRGRTTGDLIRLATRIASANRWPSTFVTLRKPRGGKAVPAMVLSEAAAALSKAHTLWPEFRASITDEISSSE